LWGNDGDYMHFKLSEAIEAMLDATSVRGERFSLTPEDLHKFFSALRTEFYHQGTHPALVTRGERLRGFVRYLIREEWPEVPVLADYELISPLAYDRLPVISLE
jgi:flagellar biosynthesis component FlhA